MVSFFCVTNRLIIVQFFFFQKTVSQNLKNTVPISNAVTAEVLDNNLDSATGSLNKIETIEVAPESASNGNGTTTIEISHNNNGNGNVQVEMTSRQRREANLGIVLISISVIFIICQSVKVLSIIDVDT